MSTSAVRLERSGGFAGMVLAAQVTVDDLPSELQALIASPPTAAKRSKPSRSADQFEFALSVPIGRRVRTYRFSEGNEPADIAALVEHLKPLLGPARP
jgi:hypothetical protein